MTIALWIIMAVVGALLSRVALSNAASDLNFLRHHNINSVREILAKSSVRAESGRLAMFVTFFVAGMVAIGINTLPEYASYLAMAFRGLMLIAMAVLVYGTYADNKARNQILNYDEANDATSE